MKCICGGKAGVIETRGNDYNVYRIRRCVVCGKEFITQETKIDASEGRSMIRKIHSIKYGKRKPKSISKRRKSRRE